ncbi:MAG: hypothetical protein M3004_06645 [Bacteroidota bacterium]|nr:hypothetical protein [Bacteroidota bacterium]
MKKLIVATGIFALAISANAQDNLILPAVLNTGNSAPKAAMATRSTRFIIGVEGGIPMGIMNTAGYKTGIGGSLGVAHNVASSLDLNFRVGYINFGNKNTTPYKYHLSVIPVMAGITYWFSPTVFAKGELGAAFNSTKRSNSTTSTSYTSTEFAYSPILGVKVSQNLALLVKYFGDGDFNWFGFGAGLSFGSK